MTDGLCERDDCRLPFDEHVGRNGKGKGRRCPAKPSMLFLDKPTPVRAPQSYNEREIRLQLLLCRYLMQGKDPKEIVRKFHGELGAIQNKAKVMLTSVERQREQREKIRAETEAANAAR